MQECTISKESFVASWVVLTPIQRRIFKYLHYMSREYKYVFPSVPRIAEVCKCGTATVKRAIRKFTELEWLGRVKRSFQSNLYMLLDFLIQMNMEDSNLFARERSADDPQNDPVLNTRVKTCSNNSSYDTSTESAGTIDNGMKEKLHLLSKCKLSDSDRMKLATRYTLPQIAQGIEDAKTYNQVWKNPIRSLMGYLMSACGGWKRPKNQ